MIHITSDSPQHAERFCSAVGELPVSQNYLRRGRVMFEQHLVKSEVFPEVLKKMELVPCRVETLLINELVEYVGWSPLFRELEQSEMTPDYLVVVTANLVVPDDPNQKDELVITHIAVTESQGAI